MPEWKWVPVSLRNFPNGWAARVQMRLRAGSSPVRLVTAVVDSGAAVSLFPRVVATSLGIPLAKGKPVELGGVTGGTIVAWEHRVRAAVDRSGEVEVPAAFAESDAAPSLIGRAGFFDRFEVLFDPGRRVTRIVGPLPTE